MGDEDDLLATEALLVPVSIDVGATFPHAILADIDIDEAAAAQLVTLLQDTPGGQSALMANPVGCGKAILLWTPASYARMVTSNTIDHGDVVSLLDEYPPVMICGSVTAAKTVELGDNIGWVIKLTERIVFVRPRDIHRIARAPHSAMCGCNGNQGVALR